MYSKNNGIVLYFLVHDEYRRSSFGTYLLYLMGKTIVHRSGKDHAAIHLMANELLNSVSMSFYTKLGFEKYVDPNHEGKSYPKPVLMIKKSTSVFNTTFFIQENKNGKDGMVWLSIEDTETFRNSSTWHMSLINPFVIMFSVSIPMESHTRSMIASMKASFCLRRMFSLMMLPWPISEQPNCK